MDNKGIILGAALGLENVQHRILVQGTGAQAVDRFRGDAQKAAGAQDLCRFPYFIFPVFGVKYPCFQIEFLI